MKVYKSTRSHFFIFLARWLPYGIFSILIVRLLIEGIKTNFSDRGILTALIILSVIFGLLLYGIENLMKMNYAIDDHLLIVDLGLTKREVKIDRIQCIKTSGYSAYGYKPALDFKGMQMIYESGRMMYISPENKDEFLTELKKINAKIVIT